MIETLYLLITGMAFLSILVSVTLPSVKGFNSMVFLLSAILCFVVSISSGNIAVIHCADNATNSTGCFEYIHYESPLIWFWSGMGLIMLVLAIYVYAYGGLKMAADAAG